MSRLTWILAIALGAGVAAADVAPDYPVTQNRYLFRLTAGEGLDTEGAQLVLITTTRPRGSTGEAAEKDTKHVILRVGPRPLQVARWHWSQDQTHRLILVQGELPEQLTPAWVKSVKPVAELDLSGKLMREERSKGDDAAFETQVYEVEVTPARAEGRTTLRAKRVKVTRSNAAGETLETEDLDDALGLRPRSGAPLLALASLLGLLGLGGLGRLRRSA